MRKLLVIAALLISTESVADLDWSGKTKVTALYPHGEGLQFFISRTSLGKYSTCGQKRFSLDINATDYNVMVSLLTTAFVAEKDVDIAIDTNTVSSCNPVSDLVDSSNDAYYLAIKSKKLSDLELLRLKDKQHYISYLMEATLNRMKQLNTINKINSAKRETEDEHSDTDQ